MVVFVMLLYESMVDLRTKSIDIAAAVLVGIIGIIFNFFVYEKSGQWLCGIAIGAAIILSAWISRQRIGYGDGIIFTVLGLCMEPVRLLWLLWFSVLAAGVYGVIGIITGRRNRTSKLPFIPFVAGCYAVLSTVWLFENIGKC